jgi:chromosome segregation ATPase
METETYQNAFLANLDFEQQTSNRSEAIPLPDEMPKRNDFSHLPKDILKSSTVENLISQNEDLMARLKVSLRRLSLLENENQRFSEESHKARMSQSSTTDQLLVWKEKDNLWKAKVDQLEKEKAIQAEKVRAFQEKSQTLASEMSRHLKYQEKIKTQVRPYVAQLKEYSRTQDIKLSETENLLANREAQLRDLRHQMLEVAKNSIYQIEVSDKKSKEMIDFYETQITKMTEDLAHLTRVQEELELKSLKLHAALERQDSLENELVAIRRSKEEMRLRLESDLSQTTDRMQELSRQNQKLGVEHADLQVRVIDNQEKIQKLEKEHFQMQEQMESLRYMWNAKNEENEKLKAAAAALERLNIELSQKLSEIRRGEEANL